MPDAAPKPAADTAKPAPDAPETDALEAADADPFFTVPVGSQLPEDEEIVSLVAKAFGLEKAHSAAVANDSASLDRRLQELSAEAHNLVSGLKLPKGDMAGIMDAAHRQVEDKHSEYRKGVLGLSEENRQAQLRQLSAANERAAMLLRIFPSPVQLLSTYGLGEEIRTHYAAQLASAGHSQLNTLARYALVKGDFALGAAIADRVAQMPKESRPFSAAKLAEAFVGKRHAALTQAAKHITAAYLRVVNAERDHVSGRPSSLNKIASGLRTLSLEKGN